MFITGETAEELLTTILSWITANIGGVLVILGFMVGLSFVMALIDSAKDGRIDNTHRGFRGRYLP